MIYSDYLMYLNTSINNDDTWVRPCPLYKPTFYLMGISDGVKKVKAKFNVEAKLGLSVVSTT